MKLHPPFYIVFLVLAAPVSATFVFISLAYFIASVMSRFDFT